MSIVLFDSISRKSLLPLTFTKAIADLRIGIVTIKKRWEMMSGQNSYVFTENYLQQLYETISGNDNIWIDASIMADENLTEKILSLEEGTAIADGNGLIAGRINLNPDKFFPSQALHFFETIYDVKNIRRLRYPWQIFQWNDEMLRSDFSLVTKNKKSKPINDTNRCINPEDIFIEEGATVNCSIMNALSGPVYIGKNATIMEGSMIRGPFAVCEDSVIKMGAKMYGASTIGPNCIAGGEIKNVVMQANSNKAHDGYLGDSVIGEWCTFGAGSSNSNVKNNALPVKMWNYSSEELMEVDLKCGMVMGDYSRTAINTSINTGTVIGICCNVFGEGLLPVFISNFTWGSKGGPNYDFEKALRDIGSWKKMKHQALSNAEIAVLKYIYEQNKA